jgi:hypothetical protein
MLKACTAVCALTRSDWVRSVLHVYMSRWSRWFKTAFFQNTSLKLVQI